MFHFVRKVCVDAAPQGWKSRWFCEWVPDARWKCVLIPAPLVRWWLICFHLPCPIRGRWKAQCGKAREIWPGLESVLWAALSEEWTREWYGILSASVGLQRQNGSPRKPDGSNVKPQALHWPGNGVVNAGTPHFQVWGHVLSRPQKSNNKQENNGIKRWIWPKWKIYPITIQSKSSK